MQSPVKLFRSLKHGDPQAVAYTAVFLFLVSVIWFSWTLLAPTDSVSLPFSGHQAGRRQPEETISLRDVLEQQRVFLTPEEVPNPFFREPPKSGKPKPREGKADAEDTTTSPANKSAKIPPSTPGNSSPSDATANEPETRTLTLRYEGFLIRPDQTTVALVSTIENQKQAFLKVGDPMDAFTVTDITSDGISLQQKDGPPVVLPRGETQSFEVPL